MKLRLLIIFTFLLSTIIFAQTKTNNLNITKLTTNCYIYTTYHAYKGDVASANGLYVVTNNGVILIDTPWDTTQFQPLLDSIEARHHQKVVLCIATHSHEDRTAGLEFYRQKNIKTYTSTFTDSLSKANNYKRAEFHFTKDTTFIIGQLSFQTFYPGAGHTADNIVVWFPLQKILYGGCFIKSTEAADLGYIKEANLQAWPTSLKNTQQKFLQPKFIIPGHDSYASLNAINHTLKLLQQNEDATLAQAQKFKLIDTNVTTGQTYTTYQIKFALGKAALSPESFPLLDSIVVFLNQNKNANIIIEVHLDSRANPNCCDSPSQSRATSITDYLISKGIAANRLTPKGYGKHKLLISDAQINKAKTQEEKEALHALNRRVVLKILSNN